MRGRKPTPTKLRLVKGNPGRRPLPQNEPSPKPATPRRPTWMSKEAKREYRRVAGELAELGLLSELDRGILVLYCVAWADFVTLSTMLEDKGWTADTADGGIKRHPAAASLRDAHERLRSAASELGMTPAARVRLAYRPDGVDSSDPLEELERRRRRRVRQ